MGIGQKLLFREIYIQYSWKFNIWSGILVAPFFDYSNLNSAIYPEVFVTTRAGQSTHQIDLNYLVLNNGSQNYIPPKKHFNFIKDVFNTLSSKNFKTQKE